MERDQDGPWLKEVLDSVRIKRYQDAFSQFLFAAIDYDLGYAERARERLETFRNENPEWRRDIEKSDIKEIADSYTVFSGVYDSIRRRGAKIRGLSKRLLRHQKEFQRNLQIIP
jgi:hypothetical protein